MISLSIWVEVELARHGDQFMKSVPITIYRDRIPLDDPLTHENLKEG